MKKQILDIVNSCESKNFKDHDIFSMFILKIINQTVDSFYIYVICLVIVVYFPKP